ARRSGEAGCCEPAGIGLHMTHWSTRSLAQAARLQGIAPTLSHSTVALILRDADLQPHRSRYWKTPVADNTFRTLSAPILWCYERAAALAQQGEVVMCVDEKPNIQALERRRPTHPMRPGLIERQEFEYVRHGTVNLLVKLVVHTGMMRGWCLEHNDSASLRAVLPQILGEHREARRIHLIWDNGSSHIAQETRDFLRRHDSRVRVLFTPAHASWLDQAELLLRAFEARYLLRGNWTSRAELIAHLDASWPEYNRLYAHPFTWSWTRARMQQWVARHGS
ncbi:IS630 family transposase, partial [Stigmatella aurantiaca]|uniref:IS630 family transposase n=1 Tax=Stigmatella aurantiaca TaxID=41 RepID=UPI001E2C8AB4